MPVTTTLFNHAKHLLGSKQIDLSADPFKIILMGTGYSFDINNQQVLADVTSSQLTTGYGYTQNDKELSGGTYAKDSVNNKSVRTFTSPTWTAAGGSIGPYKGHILYVTTANNDNILISYTDYGANQTTTDGLTFEPENIKISIG